MTFNRLLLHFQKKKSEIAELAINNPINGFRSSLTHPSRRLIFFSVYDFRKYTSRRSIRLNSNFMLIRRITSMSLRSSNSSLWIRIRKSSKVAASVPNSPCLHAIKKHGGRERDYPPQFELHDRENNRRLLHQCRIVHASMP